MKIIFAGKEINSIFVPIILITLKNTNKMKNLNDILNSAEFESMFKLETEKKELAEAGWNYEELRNFGKQIAKKIKKSK
jgi:tRNA U34 5-methylaminomethyl-2-thiouridine-forming methyltransferase MnmC